MARGNVVNADEIDGTAPGATGTEGRRCEYDYSICPTPLLLGMVGRLVPDLPKGYVAVASRPQVTTSRASAAQREDAVSWRYRVFRSDLEGEVSYSIHEVYTMDDGISWTTDEM